MFRIYTGYYQKRSEYNGIKVAISRTLPIGWMSLVYQSFAPSYKLLTSYREHRINKEDFENLYLNEINKLNKKEVYEYFNELLQYDNIVLLCYERPYQFCHRHILAKWLKEQFNWDVQEMYVR